MKDPFVGDNDLPAFNKIKPKIIEKTIKAALKTARINIDKLASANTKPTWKNFCLPLSELDDNLHKILDPIGHLRGVKDSDELREAYEACIPALSEFGTYVGQHTRLSNRYNELRDSKGFEKLSTEQKKAIDNSIRSFTLSGVNLEDAAKKRFGEISEKLSILTNEFSKNTLDATKHWTKHITDVEELDGVPTTALEVLEQAAKDKDLDGYLITLDYPNFAPIMEYCTNRELRKEIAIASSTKASNIGPGGGMFNNAPIMDKILKLKFERAKLLGYENHAEKSVVTKMAENTQEVLDFLLDLDEKASDKGWADHNELKEYAEDVLDLPTMEAYDTAFVSEKIMKEKYDVDSEEVRKYFPHTTVVPGMFKVVKTLYGIEIKERKKVDVWHKDVKFYDVYDGGKIIASFYLDLFARSDKRAGAWMGDCLIRWMDKNGDLQLPIAYLTCNFTPPIGDKPSLLTHNEVETLFHEFGHGLHHMLTKVEAYDVSGINGVEWDAVEQPSQIMENWCWNKEALSMFSGHFETGETIPNELFDKMLAAKNFLSGRYLLRQIYLSLFDFRLHMEFDPANGRTVRDILKEVEEDILVDAIPEYSRWENTFSHIFAGGYSAGYYSYKWAEVLSADSFSLFEENGVFDKETGRKFRETVLEQGGSRTAMDLFVEFRGRKPSPDALLRHNGIT